ncbi:MAG TPA: site-specific DNA-methyltransferase [Dehalococcoidia bacterium]|nr:site-specific DNA-methyltransferase [Dehalococcoidia bacterium]
MGFNQRKRGTKTSAFGSPGRINHDAASFYASKLYEGLPQEIRVKYEETPLPDEFTDKIFCKSSESMQELPENSVHLMVTSPPYNVGKEYDEDLTLEGYRQFLKRVWQEVYRVLVPGGRVCINIANLGRKPYIPLHSFIIEDMLELGLLMRGEIIWNKASSSSPSTAWGSWLSAANPTLRDIHEYILVFSKGTFTRRKPSNRRSTISKEEFLEFTKSVWTFPAEQASNIGHPAPFPVELPYRLIQLYTYEGEVVLDPFIGSGQTALAAIKTKRHYVGYDVSQEYVKLAERRIRLFTYTQNILSLFDLTVNEDKTHS